MEVGELYLTYEEYLEMGGKQDQPTFNINEFQVENRLDFLTNGRIKKLDEVPEEVKQLCFRLNISFWEKPNTIDAPSNLSSYSNGIESFGYKSGTTTGNGSIISDVDLQINSLVKEYLWMYPELVYRGRWQWKRK
jgi:hypothetical protein